MANQELIDWIRMSKSAGQSTEQIYGYLVQHGYTPEEATQALNESTQVPPPPSPFVSKRLPVSPVVLGLGAIFFILFVSGLLFFLFTGSEPDDAGITLSELQARAKIKPLPVIVEQEPVKEDLPVIDTTQQAVTSFEETPDSLEELESSFDDLDMSMNELDELDDDLLGNERIDDLVDDFSLNETDEDNVTLNQSVDDSQTVSNQSSQNETVDNQTAQSTADNQTNQTTGPTMPTGATVLAQGNFVTQQHPGVGTAIVFEDQGLQTLRLEDFGTGECSDLQVYMSSTLFLDNATLVSPSQGISGTYHYALNFSFDANSHRNVLVWCKPFSILFTSAALS